MAHGGNNGARLTGVSWHEDIPASNFALLLQLRSSRWQGCKIGGVQGLVVCLDNLLRI